MNDMQRKYQAGEIGPEEYIQALERRLAEAELNIQALAGTQIDAILESGQTTPLLLRQAQDALQRSNELLEQRVAERTAALTESEMKYRALFESSLDIIFLIRTDGTIVDANPAACQAMRMTREEIRDRGRAGIIKPDPQIEEALKRLAATSQGQGELTFIRQDGSIFLAEVNFVIVNPEWEDWTTFVTARDITKRRQAEEALRASEAKYRTLFESIDEGFCVIEVLFDETDKPFDYRFLEVNPAFVRETGLHQAVGRQMRELAPLHEDYWFEIYGQVALSGEPVRFENKAEQLQRFYDVFAFRVGDPDERKVAVLFNDISERKQAEEALRESESRLRETLESISDGFLALDHHWHYTYFNETGARMLGMRREDLVGGNVWELFPSAHDTLFYSEYHRAVETNQPVHFEEYYPEPLNMWLECHCYPSRDGLTVYFRDVTERKRIEKALHESEAHLRMNEKKTREILESISDGFFSFDRAWRATYVNQRAGEQGGYRAEDLIGKVIWDAVPVLRGSPLEAVYRKVMEERQPEITEFYSQKSGRWFELHIYPSADGISVYSVDISGRKQTEDAIQRYTEQLEKLNRELETANQELAFANRELNDFAYIASHDLQEPLRKVRQFGSMLQKSAEPALASEQNEYLERMLDAAQRMQEMITGLLDYSRITTQGNPFSQVDLAQIAREVLSDLEIHIEQTEGSVEVGNLPVIEADPLRMRQLFQNLIGNALKFHKPGVPPAVKVWAEVCTAEGKPGQFICLHVQDHGIGFDEKNLQKLFIPFMRLHGRSSYEGTGMGLSICRKIAERHGGTITANSRPGEGATFTVRLKKHQHFEIP